MSDVSVSDREIALLASLAAGRSTRQIAGEDAGPRRRVQLELRELRRRLSAKNNVHAAVIAIRRGII